MEVGKREHPAAALWYDGVVNHKALTMVQQFKIVVEKHPDGYVAYPLGLQGIVIGEGDTYEAALADVTSAIQFHIETFGPEVIERVTSH